MKEQKLAGHIYGQGGGEAGPPVCSLGTCPSTWVLGDQFPEQWGWGELFWPKTVQCPPFHVGWGGGWGVRIPDFTRNGAEQHTCHPYSYYWD